MHVLFVPNFDLEFEALFCSMSLLMLQMLPETGSPSIHWMTWACLLADGGENTCSQGHCESRSGDGSVRRALRAPGACSRCPGKHAVQAVHLGYVLGQQIRALTHHLLSPLIDEHGCQGAPRLGELAPLRARYFRQGLASAGWCGRHWVVQQDRHQCRADACCRIPVTWLVLRDELL